MKAAMIGSLAIGCILSAGVTAHAQIEIYVVDDPNNGGDLAGSLTQSFGAPDPQGGILANARDCPMDKIDDPLFVAASGCVVPQLESGFGDGLELSTRAEPIDAYQLEIGASVDPARLDDFFARIGQPVAAAKTPNSQLPPEQNDQVLVKTDTVVYAVPKDAVRIKSDDDDGISYNIAGAADPGYADICIATGRCGNDDASTMPAPPSIDIAIQFDLDSAVIRSSQKPALDRVMAVLTDPYFDGYQFEIVGHTDTSGSINRNMALSKQRADAVAYYLSQNGVSAWQLTTVGNWFRDLVPFAPPRDPIHRRVTIYSIAPTQ